MAAIVSERQIVQAKGCGDLRPIHSVQRADAVLLAKDLEFVSEPANYGWFRYTEFANCSCGFQVGICGYQNGDPNKLCAIVNSGPLRSTSADLFRGHDLAFSSAVV